MGLEVKKLSKKYDEYEALKNFSLTVKEGEIVGIIGKNGAGKTTLLNCIAGNIKPTSGKITYKKSDILENKDIINQFGILIEPSFLDYMNARENLRLLLNASGITENEEINKRIKNVLSIVGLEKNAYDYVKSYSFGMKQRLGLAQALLEDNKVFILDEPLVGLDVLGKEMVKKIVKDKAKVENKIVLFSDHNLHEVKNICDRIIYIEEGKKVFDGVYKSDKKYYIMTDQIINNVEFIKDKIENLIIQENKIIIDTIESLNQVLSIIIKNGIYINNLTTKEGTLMSFFEDKE